MSRPETLNRWKRIIDGYDREREPLKTYCRRLGVSTRMYHYYRVELYGRSTQPKLLPIVLDNSAETELTINDIRLSYNSGSISDAELSRILKLCRDL